MESLRVTHQRLCRSLPKLVNSHHGFSPITQLGLPYLLTERCKNVSLIVVRSDRRGVSNSQGGSSAVEDEEEEKKGLILGAERDESGSVVGFSLISQSGIFRSP